MTLSGLVLNVSRGDGDTTSALFRSCVDHIVCLELSTTGLGQGLRDRSGERCLAMVNVTNGADITMRLITLEFSLCHRFSPLPIYRRDAVVSNFCCGTQPGTPQHT